MRISKRIIAISILAALALWIADSIIDVLFFSHEPFMDVLILHPSTYELYIRSLCAVFIVIPGFVLSRLYGRLIQTSDALSVSEARLLEAQAVGHVGNWEWNLQTNGWYWSEENFRIYGTDPTVRPTLESFMALVDPADVVMMKLVIEDARTAAKPFDVDMRALMPDGRKIMVNVRAYVDVDAQGAPLRVFGTVQDITARKQAEAVLLAEQTLKESEIKYRTLVDRLKDGVYQSDLHGNFVTINRAGASLFGVDTPDILISKYKTMDFFVDPTFRDVMVKSLQESGVWDGEFQAMTADRRTIWLSASLDVRTDAEGNPVGYEGVLKDITERKRAEEALRTSQAFNVSLLDNSTNGVMVFNLDASIRYVNPALETITGWSRAELIGRRPPYPWWLPENVGKYAEEADRKMEFTRQERRYQKKNGEQFWVILSVRMVRVETEAQFYVGYWVDITERKRLEEELVRLYHEAQEKEQVRGELFEYATNAREEERKRIARELHDEYGQTLTGLLMSIETLHGGPLAKDAKFQEKVAKAEEIARRALEELRRMTSELRPPALDDLGLVSGIRAHIQSFLEDAGIRVTFDHSDFNEDERLSPEVETTIFRIIQEAAHNAVKHAESHRMTILLGLKGGNVIVSITDDGKGFDVQRTINAGNRRQSFGIVGMRERVSLVGGHFSIESELGKGTRVSVEIPVSSVALNT